MRKNISYLNAKCKKCGKEFYVKPYRLKKGEGKYCSHACRKVIFDKPTYIKKHNKEYYQKNKLQLLENGKKYYFKNKESILMKHRKRTTFNGINKYEYYRAKNLKVNYGITETQYNEMFNKQNGCCAICGKHQSEFKNRLHIDHNHITQKVRDLLCNTCNHGLGMFRDKIELLEKATQYLKKHN